MFREFEVSQPIFAEYVYNIVDYGAVGDGQVSNTEAFRTVMTAAAQTGGRVLVPDGIWLTGPIELLSGVELHLSDNAILLFDKNQEEYPLVITDFEGVARIRATSMLHAQHAENIAITGKGIIDGNGHLWRPVKDWKMTERQWEVLLKVSPYVIEGKESNVWAPSESFYKGYMAGEIMPTEPGALEKATPYYDFYRPVMVSLKYCNKVLIDGVTFRNSPAWNIHPHFCTNLTVRNATIFNPYHAQNGDGIDVESCRKVEIHHCDFQTGDDGICMKAGKNAEARKIPGPCENVHIHHCTVGNSHGGFVIGSEMSRGVRNVLVEDCTFINSDVGIRMKSTIGRGGVVEDIYMRNINMINIQQEAVIMTMNYVHKNTSYDEATVESEAEEDVPKFRNIYIENCVCKGANTAVKIAGLPGRPDTVRDIHITGCSFVAECEDVFTNCENIYVE